MAKVAGAFRAAGRSYGSDPPVVDRESGCSSRQVLRGQREAVRSAEWTGADSDGGECRPESDVPLRPLWRRTRHRSGELETAQGGIREGRESRRQRPAPDAGAGRDIRGGRRSKRRTGLGRAVAVHPESVQGLLQPCDPQEIQKRATSELPL